MPVSIVLAFMYAPPAQMLGESSRILYFHVPIAWVSVLSFAVSAVASIIYLADKKKRYPMMEAKFHNSSVIGMIFTVLTTITGSIWAKLMWGSYWNWDPRETSIVVLFLIYSAYFSLRSATVSNPNRGSLSAVYLILAMVTVPFFIFVIPRIYPSLHPDPVINPDMKIRLDKDMRIVLLCSVISFTFLYFYLLNIMNRLSGIKIHYEENIGKRQ